MSLELQIVKFKQEMNGKSCLNTVINLIISLIFTFSSLSSLYFNT